MIESIMTCQITMLHHADCRFGRMIAPGVEHAHLPGHESCSAQQVGVLETCPIINYTCSKSQSDSICSERAYSRLSVVSLNLSTRTIAP